MSSILSGLVIALGLVTAVWSAILFARARRASNTMLLVLLALEVLLLVQLIVAIVRVAGGERPDETATFVAYAASELLILPAGVFWSATDRSRTSVLVIFVVCFAVAVMTARMFQIWSTVG
ncbi:hypothetical protein LWF15_30210 [Kineosporia rhizophila]|uniref:hypothetical protein n=1 Tax=Kineosporia TaxID=49184 RepID=UPI000ADEDF73|nr:MULTISPECIES: hypothetical protein [Kineosporia]MCE0539780.1 hypothetical protein [Kineosporia rhizophila]GLY13366.1 hypothetical protein Kisp01_03820 [Kineosporia sp. NBRC 101677]